MTLTVCANAAPKTLIRYQQIVVIESLKRIHSCRLVLSLKQEIVIRFPVSVPGSKTEWFALMCTSVSRFVPCFFTYIFDRLITKNHLIWMKNHLNLISGDENGHKFENLQFFFVRLCNFWYTEFERCCKQACWYSPQILTTFSFLIFISPMSHLCNRIG